MKYYAVTNDPAELMHYGVKGMKWGVIRSDAQLGHPRKPRSAAYKNAQTKLSGIKKVQAHWSERNTPENREYRAYKKAEKRAASAYKKAEKRFQKHLQKAREGRLKYKGISDSEVGRIIERLSLERQSRNLSGAEKPSFGRRMRDSMANGLIEGAGRGTAAYMEERWRGRGKTTAQIKADKRMTRYEANTRVQKRKAKNEFNKEYYKQQAESGELGSTTWTTAKAVVKRIPSMSEITARKRGKRGDANAAELAANLKNERINGTQRAFRNLYASGRAKNYQEIKKENARSEREKRQQEARDKAYYSAYGKKDADRKFGSNYPSVNTNKASVSNSSKKKPNKNKDKGNAKQHSRSSSRVRYYSSSNDKNVWGK